MPKRLARALRRERGRRGWTQEQAAEAADMYVRRYQKLEEGTVNAAPRKLERLSGAYGVDVRELFA